MFLVSKSRLALKAAREKGLVDRGIQSWTCVTWFCTEVEGVMEQESCGYSDFTIGGPIVKLL
jgi:hypothetical protein